jgi:hypothetical protein
MTTKKVILKNVVKFYRCTGIQDNSNDNVGAKTH